MSELHPMFAYGCDVIVLCPKCETAGGYVRRIERPLWRRILFLRNKRYLCQECEHKFYIVSESSDEYE